MAKVGVTGPKVMETSTTTGTGTYTLAGAVTGYNTVGAYLANGDTGYFSATGVDANGNPNGDGWEEFYGTYTSAGTTLARTTIHKSSNSNNAVNWGAGTRRIILLDLPAKSKGINAVICGLTLPNCNFVRIQGVNLATGDNDLYTCPSGKRCFIPNGQVYNNSAGSITWFLKLKVSGTYYRFSANLTTTTGAATSTGGGIVLEPGESFSINTATTNGMNVIFQGFEYDSVLPFYSPKLLTLTTGDQTLYTCPTGKTAIGLPTVGNLGGAGAVNVTADGTGHTIIVHVVPSGQAVGNNYKVIASTAVAANLKQGFAFNSGLTAGDFININVNVGAPPLAYATLLEIGN